MRRGGEKQNLQSQVSFRALTCKEGPLCGRFNEGKRQKKDCPFFGFMIYYTLKKWRDRPFVKR